MASLIALKNKNTTSYRIRYYLHKQRKSLYLPNHYTLSQAKTATHYVERLIDAAETGLDPDKPTLVWIASIGPELQAKLAASGLIELTQDLSLQELFNRFDREYPNPQKFSTWRTYRTVFRRLTASFDPDLKAAELTVEQARAWRQALTKVYAEATVAGSIQRLRTVWAWAVKSGYLSINIWLDVRRGSFVNKSREYFVPMDWYHRLLDACPDQTWRTILALCRVGGLRCPSEVLRLRWADVDWNNRRLRVTSPKTEHHEGGAYRVIPLWPDLQAELDRQWDSARPVSDGGSIYIIDKWRDTEINLRTHLERIVFRAGLPAWPRLFHNLRGSRSNELFSRLPAHIAAEWMDQSIAVALQHYLHATDQDFTDAIDSEGPKKTTKAQIETHTVRNWSEMNGITDNAKNSKIAKNT